MEGTMTTAKFDKEAFFRLVGYEPHPGQLAIHRSRAARRVVACGVRWGKTKCAAMEGLASAMAPAEHSIGWVVAPTYDLADRVFRELQVTALEKLQHRIISMRESDRRLVLRNLSGGTSEIKAKSADNPVSLLGEGLDFAIVDEASRLKPNIWQAHLSQRLVDKRGWALLISTPKGKGYFFDLFKRGQGADHDPDYASWSWPSWENPMLDAEMIEAERARLPERVFAQEYGAKFVEGAGAVFRSVRECATGEWQEPIAGQRYFAGLDLAKVEDYSVLTIVNRKREVVFMDRFHRLDWALQVARIQGAVLRFNRARVFVDSTGAGEPIYEVLRKERLDVEAYPFTAKSKSALIENLSLMLEQRRLVLPRADLAPTLIDELEAFEFSVTDQGNVRTGAPGGGHDDTVISLALAAWAVRSDPAPFFFRSFNTWGEAQSYLARR
jgi:hypothetical protein